MWRVNYINKWGDLEQEDFPTLDEVQAHLEAQFMESGEPFGFRCKWIPKTLSEKSKS